jgi:perosamine synthetase
MIPLSLPDIGEEEVEAVRRALLSGWLTSGPRVEEFEGALRALTGARHAVACNSGTSALFLAVRAEGIRGEVVLPSFTFVATANAVRTAGATPAFADVDPEDGMLTPATIEAALTPRTEAVLVVHYAGQVADMDPIAELCRRRGLRLLEDSAETLGGTYRGRPPGSWGTAAFSFFPTKAITTGEGGMVTTADAGVAGRARALLAHGIEKDLHERARSARPWERSAVVPGFNLRMPDAAAALGTVQLRRLGARNARRRAIAARYAAGLADLPLDLPVERPGRVHVYQMHCPRVREGVDRDALVEGLRRRGVGASVHWDPAIHEMPAYRDLGFTDADLPVTARTVDRVLSLPMYPGLADDQVDAVIAALREELRAPAGPRRRSTRGGGSGPRSRRPPRSGGGRKRTPPRGLPSGSPSRGPRPR